ncbi:hypothetical protein FACS189454_08170 [Planctomycetales bacterium]|nr:hypothetical protein FACS189454_08170 [Planctomycetales bacterium]
MQLEETLGLNASTNGAALGTSPLTAIPAVVQQAKPVCSAAATPLEPMKFVAAITTPTQTSIANPSATQTTIVSVIPVEHFKGQAGLFELVCVIREVYNDATTVLSLVPSANSLVIRATKTETEKIIALVKRLEEEAAKVKHAAQKSETLVTYHPQYVRCSPFAQYSLSANQSGYEYNALGDFYGMPAVIQHPKEQKGDSLTIKLGNVSAAWITDVLAEIGQQINVRAEKDDTLVVTGTAEELEFMRILVRAMAVAIQRVEQSKNNEPDEKITAVPAAPQQ